MPQISVIMGIYNCEDTLEEAVGCIEKQTITDWELIMCDDGSTDSTYQIAKKIKAKNPERIVLLKNETNKGLNYTLNRCLRESRGIYIARMDADDRCSENRFEEEVKILDMEDDIAIVSCGMDFFDETGVWGNILHPEYPKNKDFLENSPFCHAPCMVRREAYMAVNGYSESKWLLRVEDYHLWIKMYAAGYRGKNLQDAFYQMRDDSNAYNRRKFRYRVNEAYVKMIAVKELNLPIIGYLSAVKPILKGLMPGFLYHFLHKKKLAR